MYQVVIVDDDTIVRVTLRSLIDWEACGFHIAEDFVNGAQALEYLREHPVDLLITDMKMPELSGLELIQQLGAIQRLPVTLALSGYNEFELVREAFRLGAYDYLLKSDLSEDYLQQMLKNLQEKVLVKATPVLPEKSSHARQLEEELAPGLYAVAVLEVDDFKQQALRFGQGLEEKLQKPMTELARQIPRVASRAVLRALYPSRYVLYYPVRNPAQYRETMVSIVRQLQAVWRDYMNISVSAAISETVDEQGTWTAQNSCSDLLRLSPLFGRAAICTAWEQRELLQCFIQEKDSLRRLVHGVCSSDQAETEREEKAFFKQLNTLSLEQARQLTLVLVALVAEQFQEYEEDFCNLFPEEVNYMDKVSRPETTKELELWINNYLSWISNYLGSRYEERQLDVILRARRFMADNYANPELSLKAVADYVGLNEKYFSSRFTKETGCTFSQYLTELRMRRAKELMKTTDMKMYEISDYVGYNNVEHFNRTFKKTYGISPGDYRKSGGEAKT